MTVLGKLTVAALEGNEELQAEVRKLRGEHARLEAEIERKHKQVTRQERLLEAVRRVYYAGAAHTMQCPCASCRMLWAWAFPARAL